jgi:hypothetical protein
MDRMSTRVAGLTGATLADTPSLCHECIWWQTEWGGLLDKRRWIEKAEKEWGSWRTVYYDEDGRVLGSMQFGPARLFPRAAEVARGTALGRRRARDLRVSRRPLQPLGDAVLFLTAIGEARDRGARALETFAYRYPEGESMTERFHVHKAVFPRDFLSDLGFVTVRAAGEPAALRRRRQRPRRLRLAVPGRAGARPGEVPGTPAKRGAEDPEARVGVIAARRGARRAVPPRAYVSAVGGRAEDERWLRLRTAVYETIALLRLALLSHQDLDETRRAMTTRLLEGRISALAADLEDPAGPRRLPRR